MAQAPVVALDGMRALRRDIIKMGEPGGPLLRQMVEAGRTAAEPIAGVTRSALPQVSGRLAGDVRVGATRTGASVREGRNAIRYAGWVEFGGHRRAPHESSRQYDPRGRYLFPHAIQLASRAAQLYSDAVQTALDNYHWTNPDTATPESVHD
jgi:hypothetical protein